MGKKAALHNLGCKVNAYETEAMQELLEQAGYEIVPFQEKADVYIINTCTVTNMADRKSRQMLHRARKMNPEAVVAACGCYVQEKPDEAADCVDIVIGNNRKKEIVRILEEYENSRGVEKKRPGEPIPAPISRCRTAATSSVPTASSLMPEEGSGAGARPMCWKKCRRLPWPVIRKWC